MQEAVNTAQPILPYSWGEIHFTYIAERTIATLPNRFEYSRIELSETGK